MRQCKVCKNDEIRTFIDQQLINQESYSEISRRVKKEFNQDISYKSIERHCSNHLRMDMEAAEESRHLEHGKDARTLIDQMLQTCDSIMTDEKTSKTTILKSISEMRNVLAFMLNLGLMSKAQEKEKQKSETSIAEQRKRLEKLSSEELEVYRYLIGKMNDKHIFLKNEYPF
ncbi:MAG: hypothetical protein ACFFCW_48255, partial [Candidatus Hodarchaeota archaeon]